MNKLSIVIPIYHNEFNIPPLYQKLKEDVLDKRKFDYEIIFIDDGSTDNSYEELLKLRALDDKIKIIKLSRNFGGQAACMTAFGYVTGDCLTVLAADLQDPPELIIQMYEKWKNGCKVVLAVRESREDVWHEKIFSAIYNMFIRKYALPNMPKRGFDLQLIDRQVYKQMNEIKEKNSNIQGILLWCGFPYETIYYTRRKREIGKSQWTFSKKIKLFIDTFLSFSYVPIRSISIVGFIIAIVALIYAVIILIGYITLKSPIQGWTSMMIVFLGVSGIQLIFLGILGEYIWRNLDETKKRPFSVVEKTIGFEQEQNNNTEVTTKD